MECLDDNAVLAYVERLIPEDERVRIADHLDRCEACLTITCAAARSTGAAETEPAEAMAEPRHSDEVGRYALVEMIGRGAMGAVYVAHDPQLDRKVALKIVRSPHYAQPEVRARLSREARAMARVTHAHVVTVYDAGELDDGVFIAMELIDGDTLARWLAAEARPWRDVVRMFVTIGRGLVAAHDAGIVHRDFKPENVLVDRRGRAAVGDFGLAVAPARSAAPPADVDGVAVTGAADLTRTGTLLGTPRYMSPEQFRGDVVDARTDQFSFAVALHEALYGAPPFDGATIGELRASVTAGRLRGRPDRTAVPAAVHRVLARALATDPAARYPSMASLLDQLESPLRRGPARTWLVAGAGGVVVAAAAIAIVVARTDAPAPAPIAAPPAAVLADPGRLAIVVERFANRTGDARLDDSLDLVVAGVLYRSTRIDPMSGIELGMAAAQLGGSPAAQGGDPLAEKMTAHDGRRRIVVHGSIEPAGTGFAISLDARGTPRGPFAATARAAGLGDVIGAVTRLAAELRAAIGDAPPPGSIDHVLSTSVEAVHVYAQAQQQAVTGELRKALELYRQALAADPELVEARAALGIALYNLSERSASAAELERALQGADRMAERERLTLFGDYYGTIGKYSEAIAAYEQLLARWPGDTRTEINVTATALDAQSWPLALELARRSVKDHPELGIVRANLVIAEVAIGHLDDAARHGAAMIAELGKLRSRPTSAGFAAVAVAQALLGHGAEARATYDQLAIYEPEHENATQYRADLALYEGRLDDAEALLRTYVDPALARDAPGDVRTELLSLARLRLRRGDRAGAGRLATLAIGNGAPRLEYLAASAAIEAGLAGGAADKIRAWGENPMVEWRLFGKLLAGDLARARGRWREAIAAYEEAGRIGPSWLTHERLGRAFVAAAAWADAERELTWCLEHRGEGTVFITPSLSFLPDVVMALARTRDGRHADPAEVLAAYRAVAALAPEAQHDPITDEARRRIAMLTR